MCFHCYELEKRKEIMNQNLFSIDYMCVSIIIGFIIYLYFFVYSLYIYIFFNLLCFLFLIFRICFQNFLF